MSCPGGACGKEGSEQRLILYGILVACMGVATVWGVGYHKTAYVMMAIPAAMYFFGEQLSRALDRSINAVVTAWRTYTRLSGRTYCPECGGVMRAGSRPVAGDGCPACEGSWCRTRDLMGWLAAYGTAESTWTAIKRDDLSPPRLCPDCAAPLEAGSLDRLQPLFDRCVPCGGHWISRLTWTWFELTPPAPAKKTARAESPLPELVFRKDAAP